MKVKVTAHIHYSKYHWEDKGEYVIYSFKAADSSHITYVGEQEIEVDIPDNYDPRHQQIAALNAQKEKLNEEFSESVMKINQQINSLMAIENHAAN